MIYPPPGRLVVNEFDHAHRVQRPHRTAAPLTGHDFISYGPSPRVPCQLNQRSLWIIKCIRIVWNKSPTHSEELGNAVAVGKEPGFDRADDKPEAHMRRRIGKPSLDAWRRAFTIPVEVDENHPEAAMRCSVVAAKRPEQGCLSVSPVDISERQASSADDPTQHRLVQIALDCGGHSRQA